MKQPKRASRHHSSRWSRPFAASVHQPLRASFAAATSRGLPLPTSVSSCARAEIGAHAMAAAIVHKYQRLVLCFIMLLAIVFCCEVYMIRYALVQDSFEQIP